MHWVMAGGVEVETAEELVARAAVDLARYVLSQDTVSPAALVEASIEGRWPRART
jgi:hypothetical protein